MDYDYYNAIQLNRIEKIVKSDPNKAITMLENYLENYPYDYHAWFLYISDLIILKKLYTASTIINEVKSRFMCDNNVVRHEDRVYKFKRNLFLNELKLLCYQDKYDDAYNLLLNNKEYAKEFNIGRVIVFLNKKLQRKDLTVDNNNIYVYDQIENYKEEKMRKYIYKHSYKYNESTDTKDNNIFVSNFDYSLVLEEIKKYIPSENKLYLGIIEDIYVFKFDLCGTDDNKWTDYFKVVCLHNTNNIITITPVLGYDKLPYIDLNYLRKDNNKVKKISMIDKFNKRYKK